MRVGAAIDKTVEMMEDRLNLNSLNHEVIAGNLANMDTPGYVAKKLTFQESLRDAMKNGSIPLQTTDEEHLNPADLVAEMRSPEVAKAGPVDLDVEMTKLTQNSLEYLYMTSLLNKKLSLLKHVIDEGGR